MTSAERFVRRTGTSVFAGVLLLIPLTSLPARGDGRSGFYEVNKRRAFDLGDNDSFGIAVDIDGDTIVVGAYSDDDRAYRAGAAYISWAAPDEPSTRNQVKVYASDPHLYDRFGTSAAIDGGQMAKLQPSYGQSWERFGVSVSLDGDRAAVGAGTEDEVEPESVYIFERDAGGPDGWGGVARIIPADGELEDGFAHSVALVGDTLVVGAGFDDDLAESSGAVYVFQRNRGGPDAWGQVDKLYASDGARNDYFGFPASFDGDTLLIGAPGDDNGGSISAGSAYLFDRTDAALAVSGVCPGEVTLTVSGLVPYGMARILTAAESGPYVLPPSSPCHGTEVDLDDGGSPLTGRADADGELSVTRSVADGRCGLYAQAVDATSCSVSDLVRVR